MDTEVKALVQEMQQVHEETMAALGDLTEDELALETSGERFYAGRTIRWMLRFLADESIDHTPHLWRARQMCGAPRNEVEWLLGRVQASRGEFLGALVGLQDDILDKEWEAGEWTIRRLITHMFDLERRFLTQIQQSRGKGAG